MKNSLKEEVSCQTVIDNIIPLYMFQKSFTNKSNIFFFTIIETFKNRGGIVKCSPELNFGYIELFGSL